MAGIEQLLKGDPRIEAYNKDAVMCGNPDAVVRPRDWQEIAEVLKWCNGNDVPITVCGARTSMTGSSVALSGMLVTTDHFNKIIDIGIKDGRPYAIVEPGFIAGELQKIVEEHGFHYPVVPTSCNEAFIGGTVATNATGEDFYKYGPTRNFVREISFLRIDGTAGVLKRRESIAHSPPTLSPIGRGLGEGSFKKGLGGYYLGGEKIDHLIGSEGTLAVITRVVLDLLPKAPKTFVILIPFNSNMEALAFIDTVNRDGIDVIRCLEFVDAHAFDIMRTHKTCPKFTEDVRALVYLKQEIDDNLDLLLDFWAKKIPNIDKTIVATTDKQKSDIHDWRHHIPLTTTELHERLEKDGGGKVAGDWWVPRGRMLEMMRSFYSESERSGLKFLAYGHLGDGHPHTNYLCDTGSEKELAKKLIKKLCRQAVKFGGGVAAEHGIGKIKRELLAIAHSPEVIAKMRDLKTRYDPKWLLGRGNIFAGDPSLHSR